MQEVYIVLGILGTLTFFLAIIFGLGSKSPKLITKEQSDADESFEQIETIALLNREIGELREVSHELMSKLQEMTTKKESLDDTLAEEVEKNRKILSQKKSSETRIGAITENYVPLMTELPYNAKNLHHLSQPIDYLYYNYEDAEITFIEVKSGNSKESKRQKLIKNIIQAGKVYYEILTINDKGINIKRAKNA